MKRVFRAECERAGSPDFSKIKLSAMQNDYQPDDPARTKFIAIIWNTALGILIFIIIILLITL